MRTRRQDLKEKNHQWLWRMPDISFSGSPANLFYLIKQESCLKFFSICSFTLKLTHSLSTNRSCKPPLTKTAVTPSLLSIQTLTWKVGDMHSSKECLAFIAKIMIFIIRFTVSLIMCNMYTLFINLLLLIQHSLKLNLVHKVFLNYLQLPGNVLWLGRTWEFPTIKCDQKMVCAIYLFKIPIKLF